MTEDSIIVKSLAQELPSIPLKHIKKVLELLSEGNTVPFIARYRKEQTGSLDEVAIHEIKERYHYIESLDKRKKEVIRLIEDQGKLTETLKSEILSADKMQRVEDLYRPYKQKRRTKATIAKENGLEPLAKWLFTFPVQGDVEAEASNYIDPTKDLTTIQDVLDGVHEIMAETISDNPTYREWLRKMTKQTGLYHSRLKDESKDEKSVYEMYYDYLEPLNKMVPHRVLATNRGEKEGVLKISIDMDINRVTQYFERHLIVSSQSVAAPYIRRAYEDSYKRFIAPSLERDIRSELTEQADAQAIRIFGENLKNLLLQSPLKGKVVMGFDPAYRTGCKLAIVDATGKLLAVDVIYPHKPASSRHREQAKPKLMELIKEYQVEMIAIGNGTASRESEQFVSECLSELDSDIYYVMVNEAGASVYSASQIARDEFPNLQVEERSAVSIGRRLQDPLAELVKIDPKSVGVGQYQHDVSQKQLTGELDFVVEMVVNKVGVNVNTASAQLLQHVAGLNKTTAKNIVLYREEHGEFNRRTELKKVPRLGPKAYEQAIGFLRIPESDLILDNTGIHPESYETVEKLAEIASFELNQIGTELVNEQLSHINLSEVSQQLNIGQETLSDIIDALKQPGRDLRESLSAPILRQDVLKIEDLTVGMELTGTIRNVIDFGAFVDIGVKQDGLVHISKLTTQFVKHPTDVVSVGDIVKVWVLEIDSAKQRIGLTMIPPRIH